MNALLEPAGTRSVVCVYASDVHASCVCTRCLCVRELYVRTRAVWELVRGITVQCPIAHLDGGKLLPTLPIEPLGTVMRGRIQTFI